jgi:hypothetical protein
VRPSAAKRKNPDRPARARRPECASTQKNIDSRERVFFIRPQALEASSKNALAYDGCTSGAIIYAYVGGNPVSFVDPTGLKTFGECETSGLFGEAQQQSLAQAAKNHGPKGKYDFAFGPNRGDRWTIGARTYNSNEFGNVLAGYTGGFMFGESLGGGLVKGAGLFAHAGDNGWFSGDLDASSRPYISLGAKLGAADSNAGRTGGVCSCGAK